MLNLNYELLHPLLVSDPTLGTTSPGYGPQLLASQREFYGPELRVSRFHARYGNHYLKSGTLRLTSVTLYLGEL